MTAIRPSKPPDWGISWEVFTKGTYPDQNVVEFWSQDMAAYTAEARGGANPGRSVPILLDQAHCSTRYSSDMSQANIEVARRFYPGTVDLVATVADPAGLEAAFGPLVHPDFETVAVPGQVPLMAAGAQIPEGPSRPIFYGLDGFVSAFRDWLSAWESWLVTATEFIEVDENRVLVLLDIRARSKRHQVEMPVEGASLLTLRDGRLARVELFFERGQALEAAGLRE